jgi:hypothetical protein
MMAGMFRYVWLGCAALIAFFCATTMLFASAHAVSVEDPLRLLAQGSGCSAWSHIRTLHFSGRTSGDGLQGPDSVDLDTQTGAYTERWTNDAFSTVSGFDGRAAWSVDRSGAAHAFNAAFATELARTDAWVARQGWCAPDRGGAKVLRSARTIERGIAYDVLSVSIPGGSVITLWLDGSGRLMRTVEQQEESRIETRFSQYRNIDGVPMPFRAESIDLSDGDSTVTTWNSVVEEPRRALADYQVPALPNDFSHFSGTTSPPAHFEGPKIFVDAIINGHGPFPMILDTGGHLILTPKTAQRLGLAAQGNGVGTGAGAGTVHVGFANIRELRLGRAVLRNQSAKVLRLHYSPSYRGPRPEVAGVIGLELFERYAVTVDPSRGVVSLANFETAQHHAGTALPISFTEDAPLVPGALFNQRGVLEIDTGNGGPVIVEPIFAKNHGITRAFRSGPASGGTGVGGAFTSSLGRVPLEIGPFHLSREGAELIRDAVGADATVVTAANIGTSVLSRFIATFDYHQHTLTLVPIPSATQRPLVDTGMGLARLANGRFRVTDVSAGSPAAKAGLQVGTVVVSVGGQPSSGLGTVDINQLAANQSGGKLQLIGIRNGKMRTYELPMIDLVP